VTSCAVEIIGPRANREAADGAATNTLMGSLIVGGGSVEFVVRTFPHHLGWPCVDGNGP
jgi:hypothetical protein